MAPDVAAAVDAVYRSDWGRIVATLIGLVGDFEIAEEAAQEAFTVAVDRWRATGVPEFPRAWIIQTARHKAIDRIRRETRFAEKLESYAASGIVQSVEEPDYDALNDPGRGVGFQFFGEPRLAANAVDGLVPGRLDDPRARELGDPGGPPPVHGDCKCFLCGLFGDLEVAHEPNQRRDDPTPIGAIDCVDGRCNVRSHARW